MGPIGISFYPDGDFLTHPDHVFPTVANSVFPTVANSEQIETKK